MNEELVVKILENQASILSMLTKLDNKIDSVKEELRTEFKSEISKLREELRKEFKSEISELREELRVEFKAETSSLRAEMYSIKEDLQAQIYSLEQSIKIPLTDITLIKYALEGVKIEIQKTREELHEEIQELEAITQEKLNYTFDKIKSLS